MNLCRKNLSALQRRSLQRVGLVLILTVITNFSAPGVSNPLFSLFPGMRRYVVQQQASLGYAAVLSALSLLPVVLAVWIASRYLKAETDEFVRMLLVRSLLWGFAVTMAGDAILSVLTMLYHQPFPISLLNADLFFIGTGIAFRLLRRSYQ